MTLAMNMTVFAEGEPSANTSGTYKLTLTGTATGHTYEAYQIFKGDLTTNTEGKTVLSNVKWGEGVTYKKPHPHNSGKDGGVFQGLYCDQ